MIFEAIRQRWNQFFFKPIDPTGIGIFRILFGSIGLINGILLWPDLLVWYGESGALSLETAQMLAGGNRINFLFLLPSGDSWVIGFYFFHMIAALFLTLGLFTRMSAIAFFLTLVSFHHRNGLILNSGDTFIRVVSFLLIFSKAGAALSLDWAWRVIRGYQPVKPLLESPWAQRMIQIQLSILYFFTFLWKMHGPTWREGVAVYYTARLEEFQRFPVPWVFENLLLIKSLTWFTLALECAMGTLIWIPKMRPFLLVLALFLHLGLEYSMNIPLFQWIVLSALVLFLQPEWLTAGANWLKNKSNQWFGKPAPVFYDGECIFCTRAVQLLGYLDLLGRFEFVNFKERRNLSKFPDFNFFRAEKEMALYTRSHRWLHGYEAFRYIACRTPSLWSFAWILFLPGISYFGRKTYAWISSHRYILAGEVCSTNNVAQVLETIRVAGD